MLFPYVDNLFIMVAGTLKKVLNIAVKYFFSKASYNLGSQRSRKEDVELCHLPRYHPE
jgi:hypothetical protein